MATALDVIKGALRSIGALEAGEDPDADTANDSLNMLNDMVAQWANQSMLVYYQSEIVFPLTSGLKDYTIGAGGTATASFVGSLTGRTLTVTSVTSGIVAQGQYLTGGGMTPAFIDSFETGAGGSGPGALGNYNLSEAQPSPLVGVSITAGYRRPLNINSAFVRVATLDYPVAVMSAEDYALIGLKTLNGPWPRGLYFQPTQPIANVTFWPVPAAGCEMHIFVDVVLRSFSSLAEIIVLPTGYLMALRWCLAELLMPEFGTASHDTAELVLRYAAQSRGYLKRTNMQPQPKMQFDPVLTNNNRTDAGWIMSGGFR